MKKFFGVLAAVFVFFALFSGTLPTSENFPNPGDPRIIRVEYKVDTFTDSVGTAFRVGPHYWLTAAHVVTNEKKQHLSRIAAIKDWRIVVFDVVKVDDTNDTALLYDPEYSGDYFSIAAGPTTTPARGIGYPGDIFKPCAVSVQYRATQPAYYAGDGVSYKIPSADSYKGAIYGGFSGGPVIDTAGRVAGMLTACGGDHSVAIPAKTLTEFMKGE